MTTGNDARIAILGYGGIGTVVAQRLSEGVIEGARLTAIVSRAPVAQPPAPIMSIEGAIERADIVIECAGITAVRDHAEHIVSSGCDLVVSSVGALYYDGLAERLACARGGQVHYTHGAIGGLDLLSTAADAGPLTDVVVRSTKLPTTLLQPWMTTSQSARVANVSKRLRIFRGSPQEAVHHFPASLNVAAAVDHAVHGAGEVTVELYADPDAAFTRHEIAAHGALGRYMIRVENVPSDRNPRTSGIVPFAVLRTLENLMASRRG
ncbi:hypothetical protein CH272_19015 [Rhodococcus sp. 05-340-1]|uniref:L-aspartate dehydrogenase n=1 Tax=Rhodococcus sp. YK2 TaxID=169536 RepID=Q8L190_9NOCA|nr:MULTISPECIES: aspartate dehydrogenase domain-containing protein [unclassified Rhodococcus (in: high G+C Gram-positive bacteria)]OZD73380.1 hypothetical protein CH271_00440 [Rhodococcus sp. 05-340-2]OZD74302.1 hypothetical protein CH272_19015 [Rhodococcus sp. 05-340-1]BAC00793.1 unnamed protein product [Rhodococcus sp. YK2]